MSKTDNWKTTNHITVCNVLRACKTKTKLN